RLLVPDLRPPVHQRPDPRPRRPGTLRPDHRLGHVDRHDHALQRLGPDLAEPAKNPRPGPRNRRAESQSPQSRAARLAHQLRAISTPGPLHGLSHARPSLLNLARKSSRRARLRWPLAKSVVFASGLVGDAPTAPEARKVRAEPGFVSR